jgi:hypothetical protein
MEVRSRNAVARRYFISVVEARVTSPSATPIAKHKEGRILHSCRCTSVIREPNDSTKRTDVTPWNGAASNTVAPAESRTTVSQIELGSWVELKGCVSTAAPKDNKHRRWTSFLLLKKHFWVSS